MKNAPAWQGIIFDLDGTLVDSHDHIIGYQRRLFDYIGVPFPEQDAPLFFTLDKDALETRYFAGPAEQAKLAQFRHEHPYINYLHEITKQPAADLLLTELHQKKLPLAILTNRGSSTPQLLNQLGWQHYFSPVYSADLLRSPKPHPEGLLRILTDWQKTSTDILYVGDNLIDVACARAANVHVATVGPKNIDGGNWHFSDLSTLRTWLAV